MADPKLAYDIVRVLRGRGHQAFLVGGCVRDHLLHTSPKDYDIATDALPEEIAAAFPEAQKIGAHFGVVLVRGASGEHVEVATFRSDHGYEDGRRPESVRFERDARQDVLRRDFTINALLEDPLSGEVIDYVGGREDLAARVVRAIGDARERFAEDHLRLLRAVRFAARLNFDIEAGTLRAIQELAPSVARVSAECVRGELIRILTEGGARRGMELLDATGLLAVVLPEVKALQGVQQPPEFHPEGDVWKHVLLMLERAEKLTATLAFGVLLHDVGKPATFRVAERIRFDGHVEAGLTIARGILSRLRFSNDDAEQILALIANHMKFMNAPRMRESTLKRFMRLPRFEEHMELHRLDCLASHGHLDTWELVRRKLGETPPERLHPPRLLSGGDLIEAGYKPGPGFARALEAVETAQLEGEIASKEEAMAVARRVLAD